MHSKYSGVFPFLLLLISIGSQFGLSASASASDIDPNQRSCTLHSRNGVPIQGFQNVTIKGESVAFCSFYRIPYARPPVKKHRFKKAQLVRLFNAKSKPLAFKTLPPECSQDGYGGPGQEDCLYVNVFTRRGAGAEARNNLMPVVVWIHGGTFAMGSGLSDKFNPSAFIEQDIVVVSFNYRLDLFGFFPVEPSEQSAMNLGLDDQRVALVWVKKHIKIFGGDPSRVTIMGWSAGSAAVNYLMYNKEAKGLFHSAIAMSGSFLSPWAFAYHALEKRQAICNAFRVKDCSLNGMITAFGPNLKDLMQESKMFEHLRTVVWGTSFPTFSAGPQYPGDNPDLRMRQGPLNDVPLLLGVTSNETKIFLLGYLINWKPEVSFIFPNRDENVVNRIVQMLRNIGKRSETDFKDHLSMADLYYGVYKFLELHSQRTEKEMYFYRFKYNVGVDSEAAFRGELQLKEPTIGAAHGDDIKLLFRAYDEENPMNGQVARGMERMWTNFIKYKNPTPSVDHHHHQQQSHHWPAFSQNSSRHVLHIDDQVHSQPQKVSPLFQLWDQIYDCLCNFVCDKPFWNGTGRLEEVFPVPE